MKKNNLKLFLSLTCSFLLLTLVHADMEKVAEDKASVSFIINTKSKKQKIDYYLSKGDEQLLRGEFSNAIDSYNEANNIKKKNPMVFLRLGEAYRMADMREEACGSYDKALKYGSKDIRVFLGLGIVYKSDFLYEKSEKFYRKAVELEKNNQAALAGLADIRAEQGKYGEAIELYKKVLQLSPTDEVKLKLAVLNFLAGNNSEIQKYGTDSADFKILNGYLELYRNPDIAISGFTSAGEHFLQALAYLKKNDMSNAKKSLDVLIGQKEDTLSKRLASALDKRIQ